MNSFSSTQPSPLATSITVVVTSSADTARFFMITCWSTCPPNDAASDGTLEREGAAVDFDIGGGATDEDAIGGLIAHGRD